MGEERASFSVIEFPGVLRNPRDPTKAIAALGGDKAVRRSATSPAPQTAAPLTLNLRPGVGNSSSNIVAEKITSPSNLFVLQVTEETPQPSSAQPDGVDADGAPSARRNAQGFQPSVVKASILGNVTALTSFRSLADFQYHSRPPKRGGVDGHSNSPSTRTEGSATASREMQTMSDLDIAAESMFQLATGRRARSRDQDTAPLIERLRPARFVRSNLDYGTTDYWFRQFGVNTEAAESNPHLAYVRGRELGEDRRSDANRLVALSHRVSVDAETVPQRPTEECLNPPVIRGVEAFNTLCEILDKLFEERPLWIRRALHDGIPKRLRKSFKRAITTVAYSFQGPGPFHQAWIRYGYDPRKDPSSRQYQVVEVRCNHPVIRAAIRERRKTPPEEPGDDEEFKLPEAYTLSYLPMKNNNFVQVCDISIQPAVDFCKQEECVAKFDKKYGFFSEAGYQKLVKIVKSALVENSTQLLGRERVEKIMLPYTRSGLPKRKRARLSEVVKPKDPEAKPWIVIKNAAVSRRTSEWGGKPAEKVGADSDERTPQGIRVAAEGEEKDEREMGDTLRSEEHEPSEHIVGAVAREEDGEFDNVEGYEILGDDHSDDDSEGEDGDGLDDEDEDDGD